MPVRPDRRLWLGAGVAALVALPALAQESLLPPGFNESAPAPERPASDSSPAADSSAREAASSRSSTASESTGVVESDSLGADELAEVPKPPPPVEIPEASRRDPRLVGAIDPQAWGFGPQPWGGANGTFLSGLMRRLDTPLPSRWLHIALRNALLARSDAPPEVHPVDWVAERAWLLLRMGEADAAAMLVAGVDVSDFTPKMSQVAVQSALASADPGALCPLRGNMAKVESKVLALTDAMCAGLSGEASSAARSASPSPRRAHASAVCDGTPFASRRSASTAGGSGSKRTTWQREAIVGSTWSGRSLSRSRTT